MKRHQSARHYSRQSYLCSRAAKCFPCAALFFFHSLKSKVNLPPPVECRDQKIPIPHTRDDFDQPQTISSQRWKRRVQPLDISSAVSPRARARRSTHATRPQPPLPSPAGAVRRQVLHRQKKMFSVATHLILAARQGRRDQGHLGAAALGHEPPGPVDDHPEPVHVEAAVAEGRLLDLVAGAGLDRVDAERGDLGRRPGCDHRHCGSMAPCEAWGVVVVVERKTDTMFSHRGGDRRQRWGRGVSFVKVPVRENRALSYLVEALIYADMEATESFGPGIRLRNNPPKCTRCTMSTRVLLAPSPLPKKKTTGAVDRTISGVEVERSSIPHGPGFREGVKDKTSPRMSRGNRAARGNFQKNIH